MNFPNKENNRDIQSVCPECNAYLSMELTHRLLGGETIVCERCGFQIKGIPIKQQYSSISKNKPKHFKKQTKGEEAIIGDWEQTLEDWKKEWKSFTENWKKFWDKVKIWPKKTWLKIKNWSIQKWNIIKAPFVSKQSNITENKNSISKNKSEEQTIKKEDRTYSRRFDPITGKLIQSDPSISQIKVNQRFDPFTGKPIASEPINHTIKIKGAPENTLTSNASEKNTPKIDSSEVFAVLKSENRIKLLNLPISEFERQLIAKSFIYLTDEQQETYLEELKNVNTEMTEELEDLIQAIHNMPIPKEQQEILINQLNYIPDKEQLAFIETVSKEVEKEIVPLQEKREYDPQLMYELEQQRMQVEQIKLQVELETHQEKKREKLIQLEKELQKLNETENKVKNSKKTRLQE